MTEKRFGLSDHRHNLFYNGLHEACWGFGIAFHTTYAVVPLFLKMLGAPPIIIGSAAGIFTVCAAIPQIPIAFLGQRIRNLKKGMMVAHSVMIPPMLLAGFVFGFLAPSGPSVWMIYFSCLVLFSIGVGVVLPIWADFLEQVHLPERRGEFFGVSFAITNGAGFIGGFVVNKLLNTVPFPSNFGFGFLIYAFCIFLAVLLYCFYVYEKLQFDISEAGIFTAITVLLSGSSSFLFGKLGDQIGHKHVFVLVFLGYLGAMVTALLATKMSHVYLIFVFLGIGQGGFLTTAMSLIFEFAGEMGDKKIYFALTETLTAPLVILFIVMSGIFIPIYGMSMVLVGLGVFITGGVIALAFFTHEPRSLSTQYAPPE